MASTVIRDTPDGPVEVDLETLPADQLKTWAALGHPDAIRALASRPSEDRSWQARAADRIRRGEA